MKHNATLTITSLISIFLVVLHVSDDIARGFEPGAGLVGGRIAGSSGMLLWVLTALTLGVTATVSVILSGRGLWSVWRTRS